MSWAERENPIKDDLHFFWHDLEWYLSFPEVEKTRKEAGLWGINQNSLLDQNTVKLRSPFNIHGVKLRNQLDIIRYVSLKLMEEV